MLFVSEHLSISLPPNSTIRTRPKLGFVLSGGYSKGSFQVGALLYLYSISPNFRPDVVVGTSVGAINGIKVAEGGDLADLEQVWLHLREDADMIQKEIEFEKLEEIVGEKDIEALVANSLIGAGALGVSGTALATGLVATLSLYGIIVGIAALVLFGLGAFFSGKKAVDFLKQVSKFLNSNAIYNLNPVKTLLENNMNISQLENSGIEYYAALVGLNLGRVRYADKFGNLYEKWNLRNPIQQVQDRFVPVIAAASQPVIHKPQRIGNDLYVDGGVREILPIKAALDLGCDQVIAILVSPTLKSTIGDEDAEIFLKEEEDEEQPTCVDSTGFKIPRLGNILLRTLDHFLDEIKQAETNPEGGWKKPVTIIRPEFQVHGGEEIVPGLIRINMNYGWMRAYEVYTKSNLDTDGRFRGPASIIDSISETSMTPATKIAFLRSEIWKEEENLLRRLKFGSFTCDDIDLVVGGTVGRSGRGSTRTQPGTLNLNYIIDFIRHMKRLLRDEMDKLVMGNPSNLFKFYRENNEDPRLWFVLWENHYPTYQSIIDNDLPDNPWSSYSDNKPFYVYMSLKGKLEITRRRKPRPHKPSKIFKVFYDRGQQPPSIYY